VFHRACAHAIAETRHEAHAAATAGDRTRALALFDQLCREEPGDTNALGEALDAALAAEKRDEAVERARQILARHDPMLAGRAEMTLGDLALLGGDASAAREHYAQAAQQPLDESTARLVTVKQALASWPPSSLRDEVARFLTTPQPLHDQAIDLVTLRGLVDAHPERALLHYLLARQLASKSRWAEVVTELSPPIPSQLPDARFTREADRVRAQALFHLGRYDEARAIFAALAHDPEAGTGAQLEADDWRQRCDFARATAATAKP
jgi:tetratricopeptide (TPR) repeat protein